MIKIEFDGIKIQADSHDEAIKTFNAMNQTINNIGQPKLSMLDNLVVHCQCPNCNQKLEIKPYKFPGR